MVMRRPEADPIYCAMHRALAAVHGRGSSPCPQNYLYSTTRPDLGGTSRRCGVSKESPAAENSGLYLLVWGLPADLSGLKG
jgi:hypothetical protein